MELFLSRTTSAAGTGYCRVYNADTNALIGTIGSVDVSTITGASTIVFNATPIAVTSPTNIIVCFEYSDTNAIDIKATSSGDTSWGYLSRYNGSAWSNLASEDLMFFVQYQTYRVHRSFLSFNTSSIPAAGKAWINKGGTTKLGLFSNRDIAGNTPTGNEYVVIRSGNSGGSSYPYLYVEYTLPAPTVTTQAVTDITTTTATGNGNVTSDGGSAITERGLVWATTANPTTAGNKVTAEGTTGDFSASLTSLTPGTLYYVRAYATNAIGTSYGNEVTFTAYKAPTVTTQAVSSIGTTTATGNGTITDLGIPDPTEHGVVWNTNGSFMLVCKLTDHLLTHGMKRASLSQLAAAAGTSEPNRSCAAAC